jgi:hypothetical protein
MNRPLALVAGVLIVAAAASAQVPQAPTGPARALPTTVLNAFQKAYPSAAITAATQEREGGQVAFRVECQDRAQRRVLVYGLNGTLLEASEQVGEKELPAPVAAAVKAQKASYVRGMKVTRGGLVHYELTLRGNRKSTMIVKPDGAVVSYK